MTGPTPTPGRAGPGRLLLLGIAVLMVLVAAADRQYRLFEHPSHRYRFHAIPVALSVLYHGHPHDYTGFLQVATPFHNKDNDLRRLMAEYADPSADVGTETYFWTSDDRGLADYVILAFALFGPEPWSLSALYLLILYSSVGLFLLGFRRAPTVWLVPLLVLLSHLFLLHAYQIQGRAKLVDGSFWLENVALYESRVFELLAALPWFHLALAAVSGVGAARSAWLTAIPQAAVILFLFHARSTIGWEYLALCVVCGGAAAGRLGAALVRWERPRAVARPLAVAAAVVGSVLLLGAYKKAVYHPAYFADRGPRTFWHNALIGFTYHPQLRDEFRLKIDDEPVLHWIIRDTRDRGDPRFNPDWSTATYAASSLGGATSFDWTVYEAVARDLYLRTWGERPGQVLKCYAVYKPKDVARQVRQVVSLTARTGPRARWWLLGAGLVIAAAGIAAVSRPSPPGRPDGYASLCGVAGVFLMFSLIPSVAFYAALPTMTGIYLGLTVGAGVGTAGLVRAVRRRAAGRGGSQAVPTTEDRVGMIANEPAAGPGRWAAAGALLRRNAAQLTLLGTAVLLLGLLYQTDRDLGLYKASSHRYRFHAIPVALAQIYHHAPHDYTSYKHIAHPFQNTERDIHELIWAAINYPPVATPATYFWAADDRGLADYVTAAFRLFGPQVKSLAKFYFVLLAAAVLLFFAGYWRSPVGLAAPVLVLFGTLCLAQVMASAKGAWEENISLYESRLFDLLALTSVLHLAVLVAHGPRVPRAAWVTAVPQAGLLLFLYHARSSLGWQYLGLFSLVALRAGVWGWRRWRAAERPAAGALLRPALVGGLLAASLVGLGQYKRAVYNPEYFREQGSRTFWHNALMGYSYHPSLRADLPMPGVSDHDATRLVLKRMRETNDPRLDPTWELDNIMNSGGGHCVFDWKTYEQVAREIYFDVWRTRTGEAAECYYRYKPLDILGQIRLVGGQVVRKAAAGDAWALFPALAGLALCLAAVARSAARSADGRPMIGTLGVVTAALIPVSLIPGMAFYAALTNLSCFYVGLVLAGGLFLVRGGVWISGRLAAGRPAPRGALPAGGTASPTRMAA